MAAEARRIHLNSFRIALANIQYPATPQESVTLAEKAIAEASTEHAAKIVRRTMDLNPHHAGWFHFALIWDHFHKGDYEKALEQATRMNMPGFYWQPLAVACICGHLGRQAQAAAAVEELRKLDKDFDLHAREHLECWFYSSGLMGQRLDGLSKAGLDVPPRE